MEIKVEQSSSVRMLVTKQHELILPISRGLSNLQRQGVIFSEVSTPSGVKLVQLMLNQEKGVFREGIKAEHIMKPDPELAPDVCTICGETFSKKVAFNAHIKVHLKEKLKRRAAKLQEQTSLSSESRIQPNLGWSGLNSKRKLEKTEDYQTTLRRIKIEPGLSIKLEPMSEPEVSSTQLNPAGHRNPTPDMSDLEDNFVSSEFSKEMEINRVDLNNELSSILDQIEKDFEAPNLDMSDAHLETPPDSDSEASEYLSSILTDQSSSSPFTESYEGSEAGTPSSRTFSNSLEDTNEISFEKLLDVDSLNLEQGGTQAQDHDYLVTSPNPGSLSFESLLSSPSQPSDRQIKGSNLSVRPLGLINNIPARILIHRSQTDSKIINIFGMNSVSQPSPSYSQDSEETTEDGEGEKEKVRGRQSAECGVCGKTITTKNMARHMEKHTGKKKFQCDVCQAAFFQKTHLKNHILLHESSEYYECTECGQKFLRRTDFQKHLKLIHSIETPLSCSVCGAQFNEIQKLEIHKQSHTGERKELCGLCGEKLANKSAMISHMQQHTSPVLDKPFSCSVCHKTFSQKSHLNRHIKSHGGEQDLVCLVCSKQCKNKVELVRHRSSHMACSICKTLFDTKVQLQQHLLRAHPAQPTINYMSPGSTLDLDMFDGDSECSSPLSRSPVDILSTHIDSSPCPSSVDSSHLDILESGFPHFLTDFSSDEPCLENQGRSKNNLSLHDISDSSFFDINQHLDEDLLSTDIFSVGK